MAGECSPGGMCYQNPQNPAAEKDMRLWPKGLRARLAALPALRFAALSHNKIEQVGWLTHYVVIATEASCRPLDAALIACLQQQHHLHLSASASRPLLSDASPFCPSAQAPSRLFFCLAGGGYCQSALPHVLGSILQPAAQAGRTRAAQICGLFAGKAGEERAGVEIVGVEGPQISCAIVHKPDMKQLHRPVGFLQAKWGEKGAVKEC
eukprot:1157320-Pelagomonas_calceolata.AAC.8